MSFWGSRGKSQSGAFSLRAASCPSNDLVFTNCIFVDNQTLASSSNLAFLNSQFVYVVSPHNSIQQSTVGLNTIQRRELHVARNDDITVTPFEWPGGTPIAAKAITFEIDTVSKKSSEVEFEAEDLIARSARNLQGHVPTVGQSFCLDLYGVSLKLQVSSIVADDSVTRATITSTTSFYFSRAPGTAVKIKGAQARSKEVFKPDFDFEKMGIGGLDKEFSDIFRRAFASRVLPVEVVESLGIQHVKGMLLYGPPGTGKTLLARQIGKMLNGKEPKVVNGPEILNKYVGQSEENIRNLFIDAEKDFQENGNNADLHIIIFDEIDAICKQRGSGASSSNVGDTVVNQMLSKIDGVNSLNNILIIGMTNRKDMIDEALLRPGRLEVHIEISLPDEDGRRQILQIHTSKMRDTGALQTDVNLNGIATETKNYSGAEIAGVCRSAAGFAMNRHIDYKNLKKEVKVGEVQVTMTDFQQALLEVQPAFGMGKEDFTRRLLGGFLIYGERMQGLLEAGERFREEVNSGSRSPLLSLLIEGPSGTGKTALAAMLAIESQFPFVRFVSPESYVGYSEAEKCRALAKVFDDAHKSSLSVIVLDDIERMIDYSPIGPRFSNSVIQTIMVLTKQVPPKNRRLLVLATTSCVDVMEKLGYTQSFSAVLSTCTLNRSEIASILNGTAKSITISEKQSGTFSAVESNRIAPTNFQSDSEKDLSISMLEAENLGIKKLLMILNMARKEDGGQLYMNRQDLGLILTDVV